MHAFSPAAQRPGYAKRPANFAEIKGRAVRYRPAPVTKDRIIRAISFGTPHLPLHEKAFLCTLASFLSREQIDTGHAFVYASNLALRTILGVDESTIRRLKRRAEHTGYIIRNFTNANHPHYGRAIDLRPLLAQLPEMERVAAGAFAEVRRLKDMLAESATFDREEIPAPPGISARHIQSETECPDNTVPSAPNGALKADAPRSHTTGQATPAEKMAASRTQFHERRDKLAADTARTTHTSQPTDPASQENCSPSEQAGWPALQPPPVFLAETARNTLRAAYQLCPRLQPYLDEGDIDALAIDRLIAGAGKAITHLMPDRQTDHTWRWAVRNHGWRAIPMLVAALEDTTVRDRYRYFGALATNATTPDLSANLRKIRFQKAKAGAAPVTLGKIKPPIGADAPAWSTIKRQLAMQLTKGAMDSWIAQLAFHGIENRALHLSSPSSFALEYVRTHYAHLILEAAQAAGFEVEDLELSRISS